MNKVYRNGICENGRWQPQKNEYWNHFVENYFVFGIGGGHGVTGPKLRKIKPMIFEDRFFWSDIIERHNGESHTPEQLKNAEPEIYEHCLGNFWGMICQTLTEEGLIK